jgi:hypothetical protein
LSQDLEPEYITVSHDSRRAWVTLQENNAVGIIDLPSARYEKIVGLGFKSWNEGANRMDASDRDGPSNGPALNIQPWPVFGMYQPDAIRSYRVKGRTYLITANEGDARAWPGFSSGPPSNMRPRHRDQVRSHWPPVMSRTCIAGSRPANWRLTLILCSSVWP